jgi:RNA polymerase sigma-70 factor (ECF subfamily)
MSHLRLVSMRPKPQSENLNLRVQPPSLEAFQREFDYIIRTLRRLGVSPNDVEDLAHEVFLVLFQSWDKYDASRPVRAYIFGIAFRVAGNHIRKRKREILFAVTDTTDSGPAPDQRLETSQVRKFVLRALDRVPMERRAVLIMHDIDKLPMAEIASNLSIFLFTGYSRLRKARKEFAEAMTSLLGASAS